MPRSTAGHPVGATHEIDTRSIAITGSSAFADDDTANDKELTMTDKMLSRKEGGVGIVTFNNPERLNAVSLDMWEATKRILDDFAADNDIRVVVRHRRRRQGLRVRRRHFEIRERARQSRSRALLRRQVRSRLCQHLRISQADHRHDPRLLHRRRARAGDLLRPAHRHRQFALRGAGRQARAGLRLCGPEAPGRHRRPGLRQGNLLHRAPVRRPGSARHGPGQPRGAVGRARNFRQEPSPT